MRHPRFLTSISGLVLALALALTGCSLGGGGTATPAATARPTATAAAGQAPTGQPLTAKSPAPAGQVAAGAATPAGGAATPAAGANAAGLPDIAAVAAKVRPATVLILNEVSQRRGFPGANGGAAAQDVPQGAGSGVIYDPSGYIITNNHVVEGAQKLVVVLPPPDNRSFEARLIGRDPQTDLAVVKIDATNLPSAPLGNSGDLQVGQWVVAIGNALALPGGPTVTAGVVSAVGRDETEPGPEGAPPGTPGPELYDLIQTDAAINPGNSGGPLVNMQGQVVGINTLGTTQAQGIGFAISIDGAKPIIQELRQSGKITRGFLGIVPQTVTPSVAGAYDLARTDGVLVLQVEQGTPAAQAGLQQGDIIYGIDDVQVRDQQDLQHALTFTFKPGDKVTLKVNRNGQDTTVQVTLAEKPTQ
ncbi:MAG TPA: trypsin-like peptidase domain-containing protein [Thermomicrobiales bacterium]|nr:trypsin-like peptidase domain-containing protein [Thermomicrobiales bacterium]